MLIYALIILYGLIAVSMLVLGFAFKEPWESSQDIIGAAFGWPVLLLIWGGYEAFQWAKRQWN